MSESEKKACMACGGSGKCSRCGGAGNVVSNVPTPIAVVSGNVGGKSRESRMCSKCYGSGFCQACKGTGKAS
ncbi:MAG: hypothetical protein H6Q05_1867 [Acidobacteria bacterium]|jgi:hypothetical protein|nr:hypothetical protein [Acidobacteriota bacterium]